MVSSATESIYNTASWAEEYITSIQVGSGYDGIHNVVKNGLSRFQPINGIVEQSSRHTFHSATSLEKAFEVISTLCSCRVQLSFDLQNPLSLLKILVQCLMGALLH